MRWTHDRWIQPNQSANVRASYIGMCRCFYCWCSLLVVNNVIAICHRYWMEIVVQCVRQRPVGINFEYMHTSTIWKHDSLLMCQPKCVVGFLFSSVVIDHFGICWCQAREKYISPNSIGYETMWQAHAVCFKYTGMKNGCSNKNNSISISIQRQFIWHVWISLLSHNSHPHFAIRTIHSILAVSMSVIISRPWYK